MEAKKSTYKLILFGTDGCPECEEQKRILKQYFSDDDWHYIDIDSHQLEELELMNKYQIHDPPTLLIIKQIDNNKSRIFRHVGVISANRIRKFIDDF